MRKGKILKIHFYNNVLRSVERERLEKISEMAKEKETKEKNERENS